MDCGCSLPLFSRAPSFNGAVEPRIARIARMPGRAGLRPAPFKPAGPPEHLCRQTLVSRKQRVGTMDCGRNESPRLVRDHQRHRHIHPENDGTQTHGTAPIEDWSHCGEDACGCLRESSQSTARTPQPMSLRAAPFQRSTCTPPPHSTGRPAESPQSVGSPPAHTTAGNPRPNSQTRRQTR